MRFPPAFATYLQRLRSVTDNPEQELRWLLQHVTGSSTSAWPAAQQMLDLTPTQQQQLQTFLDDRVIARKPLQYILGTVPFCGLDLIVRPPVLIPRPETEELCSWLVDSVRSCLAQEPSAQPAADAANRQIRVLDLCSGSGNIALSLAYGIPGCVAIGRVASQLIACLCSS